MPRINVIEYAEAEGRLKEIYDELINSRGKLARVHQIQSLHPESIVKHMELYMEIMYSRSPLTRVEREMAGVVVSVANGCHYCQKHHAVALNQYWKNNTKISQLIDDHSKANLSDREKHICNFARHLTLYPQLHNEKDYTDILREAGLSDHAILDVTLVVAYFNFVNRIVLSLEVELEADEGKGYKY